MIDDDTKLAMFLILIPFGTLAMFLVIVVGGPVFSAATILQAIAVLITAASSVMLTGRGAWAVAGYNTMSPEERSRYDPKEVARGCGFILLGTAAFLALVAYGGIYLMLAIVAMAGSMFTGFIYMNICARR